MLFLKRASDVFMERYEEIRQDNLEKGRSGDVAVEEHLSAPQNEIDYGDLQSAAGIPIGDRGVLCLELTFR